MDDTRPVPAFGASIVLKVSRLSFEEGARPVAAPAASVASRSDAARSATASPSSSPIPSAASASYAAPVPSSAPVRQELRAPPPAAPAPSDNLLGIEFDEPSVSPATAASSTYDPFAHQGPLGGLTSFDTGAAPRPGVATGMPTLAPGGPMLARPAVAGATSPAWGASSSPRGIPGYGGAPAAGVMGAGQQPRPGRPPMMNSGARPF